MREKITPPDAAVIAHLNDIGAQIRLRRKELKLTAQVVADSSGISRVTLHRIEKGEAGVAIGAYLSVLYNLGLDFRVATANSLQVDKVLPNEISIGDYQELRKLAWQLPDAATLTPAEAWGTYSRNWRHLDINALTENEKDLIRMLESRFEGTSRLV